MSLTGVVIFTLASLASGLVQNEILLPRTAPRLDVLGAVTVTAATGSFIYGMLNAGDTGWADLGARRDTHPATEDARSRDHGDGVGRPPVAGPWPRRWRRGC